MSRWLQDRAEAPRAAEALKFSPSHLKDFGVVDRILPEPTGGAHRDCDAAAATMKSAILSALKKLGKKSPKKLLSDRYAKYRSLGHYEELAT